jgi:predicted TIM-barrel fold metal-dependent hydrolase
MGLIDAHAHVFEKLAGFNGKGELRAIGGGKARWACGEVVNMIPPAYGEEAFTAESLISILSKFGVEKAVLLQGSFYGFQNEYVYESVKKYPDIFVGAGTFDPFGTFAKEIYQRLTNELAMHVLKFETSSGCGLMSYHKDYLLSEVFNPIAKEAAKHDQVLVLDIGSPGMASFQISEIRKMALENPSLVMVICHLFAPTLRDEEALRDGLKDLKLDNIFFDTSAIPFNMHPEVYPYPTGAKFVRIACDIVGSDHLMWGSDVPSVLCHDSYRHLFDFLEISSLFSSKELDNIYFNTAKNVYFSSRPL